MPNVFLADGTMTRRPLLVILILVFCLPIAYILYSASPLLALIFEDGLTDAVNFATIEEHGNATGAVHPIPKIIHQTWKNKNIPEQWQIAQYTWYALFQEKLFNFFSEIAWTFIPTITIWYNIFLVSF